jgi:hypothetical protein
MHSRITSTCIAAKAAMYSSRYAPYQGCPAVLAAKSAGFSGTGGASRNKVIIAARVTPGVRERGRIFAHASSRDFSQSSSSWGRRKHDHGTLGQQRGDVGIAD